MNPVSCIMDDHASFMIMNHASVMIMNHCESSMIMHHHASWIMIHHGSSCIMHDHSSPATKGSPFMAWGVVWEQGQTRNSQMMFVDVGSIFYQVSIDLGPFVYHSGPKPETALKVQVLTGNRQTSPDVLNA